MNYKGVKEWVFNCLETQLSEKLYYHGKHHTLDVLEVVKELCEIEKIDAYHARLLKTAALMHDIGFTKGNKEHEKTGCEMALELLPRFGYTSKEIEIIQGMIMATKIPQSPKTLYEEILCDADLDYLGRDDFFSIGRSLYEELLAHNVLESEEAWNRVQVYFLENHNYFTTTNKERRAAKKQKHLEILKNIVNN